MYCSDLKCLENAIGKVRLKEKYFKSSDRVSCSELEKVFLHSSTTWANYYKLGLALIVEGVFIVPNKNIGIDMSTFSIVGNLDIFFDYPWSKVGFQRVKKLEDAKAKNDRESTYIFLWIPNCSSSIVLFFHNLCLFTTHFNGVTVEEH